MRPRRCCLFVSAARAVVRRHRTSSRHWPSCSPLLRPVPNRSVPQIEMHDVLRCAIHATPEEACVSQGDDEFTREIHVAGLLWMLVVREVPVLDHLAICGYAVLPPIKILLLAAQLRIRQQLPQPRPVQVVSEPQVFGKPPRGALMNVPCLACAQVL